jgi:glycosyltransferase involved in cell wall biosynthesis
MIDIGGIAATRISWLYMPQHKISVIINNYNYAQFLRECIDSALAQTYLGVEVIAVDDGSKDDSANIIKGYGSKVIPVLKENGGQGSAFNAGYAASTGDIVLFLDADDVLLPDTIQQCSLLFDIPDVVKVHWPLYFIDKRGNRTGEIKEPILPEGDFRQIVHRQGPMAEQLLPSAPTSGNAYRRQFLHKVLPMPEEPYRISADAYLFGLAPAFGIIRRANKPLGLYRAHGTNTYGATDFLQKVKNGVRDYEQQSAVLSKILRQDNPDFDTSGWGEHAWWLKIQRAITEIEKYIPVGAKFVLIDDDALGSGPDVLGRIRLVFNEQDSAYGGLLEDGASCIRELEKSRSNGARYAVFTWTTNWWTEYYRPLFEHLVAKYRCLESNPIVTIYDIH